MTTSTEKRSRILVVDDEPVVCDSIRMLLGFDGHEVWTANSAEEAQEIFSTHTVDVLITDYAMPRMNGSELAIILCARSPGLRVVLVTAYAEMLGSWGADLSAVNTVVSKPFRLEDLRSALEEVGTETNS